MPTERNDELDPRDNGVFADEDRYGIQEWIGDDVDDYDDEDLPQ